MLYNLADIIKYNPDRGLSFSENSISYQYISKFRKLHKINSKLEYITSGRTIDYALLRQIVLEKSKNLKLLPKNCLGIHLRLGDVLNEAPHKKDILRIITKNKLNLKCNSIAIFYGFHKNENINDSLDYIEELIRELKLLKLKVIKYSGEVDEDFILLSTANYYIPGIRGFGWLTGSINSGKVFWDLHNPPFFPWVRKSNNIPECMRGYNFQRAISGEKENIGMKFKMFFKLFIVNVFFVSKSIKSFLKNFLKLLKYDFRKKEKR